MRGGPRTGVPQAVPRRKKAAASKKKRKAKQVSWGVTKGGVPKGPSAPRRKKKGAAKLATDEGGYRQPRGRPPHDACGVKMQWDRSRGLWVSAATGEPRSAQ